MLYNIIAYPIMAEESSMPLETDQVVNNRYRVARLLGQGGAVYPYCGTTCRPMLSPAPLVHAAVGKRLPLGGLAHTLAVTVVQSIFQARVVTVADIVVATGSQ